PIRTLLIILGDKVLSLKDENFVFPDHVSIRCAGEYKKIKVKNIKDYFKRIEDEGIILSSCRRKEIIAELLNKEAKKLNASVYPNEELLLEVSNLVERPNILSCSFESKFLKLPKVVLLASMAKYQRVFALVDKNNNVLDKFLAIIEDAPQDASVIKNHYEFVLNARLKDADFFYQEDIKISLDSYVDGLKKVLLHNKLGSLFDKIKRLEAAAGEIGNILSLEKNESKNLLRAVYLSKADLLTRMVCEFPSLEGVVGGIYAKYFKENAEVVNAISEHYKPRTNDDDLADNKLGALLSMLDKIYNVIGIIGIGIIPSGSEDPFTIRRQIQSIIRILIQYDLGISLQDLFSAIHRVLKDTLTVDEERIKEVFLTIAQERFCVLMKDENMPQDLIHAVVSVNFKAPNEAYLRIKKMFAIYGKEDFFKTAKVAERTANIIKGEKDLDKEHLNQELFKEAEEQELWEAYLKHKDKVIEKIHNKEYDVAAVLYGEVFYDIIHRFFDRVLVNVEDYSLRRNRKVLMWLINDLLTQKVADLKGMEVLKDAM
ncbi:MAG: glycine--tRNA ligase subunit beta, partial [Candidatus Saelkia tenebricola]|nr:glycine--tRNA ligase subunit beta [Candidatus Saelkia tenebricola]